MFKNLVFFQLFVLLNQSSEEKKIDAYVHSVDSSKLILMRITKRPNYFDKLGRDTIFYAYDTDFPKSATLYYLSGKLVKIKEVIRTSSLFATNNYYLKDEELLFAEEKQVVCPFAQQLNNMKYKERDYVFHARYYFVDRQVIANSLRGSRIFQHSAQYTSNFPKDNSINFFVWQAARYVLVSKIK